jgi:hypothetical protein
MWCCWISPGHNPAATQWRGRRAPNIGAARVFGAEAQVSIRSIGSTTRKSVRCRTDAATGQCGAPFASRFRRPLADVFLMQVRVLRLEVVRGHEVGCTDFAKGFAGWRTLRRTRCGFVRPARFRICLMVLGAGHSASGYKCSRRALTLRGPHVACLLRTASTSCCVKHIPGPLHQRLQIDG